MVGRVHIWWVREGGPYSGIIEMAWEVCSVKCDHGWFVRQVAGGLQSRVWLLFVFLKSSKRKYSCKVDRFDVIMLAVHKVLDPPSVLMWSPSAYDAGVAVN